MKYYRFISSARILCIRFLTPSCADFRECGSTEENAEQLLVNIPKKAFTVVDEKGDRITGGKHYTIYAGFSQPDLRSEELTGMFPVRSEFRRK